MLYVAQDELNKSLSLEGSYTNDTLEDVKKGQDVTYNENRIGVGGLIKSVDSNGNFYYHLLCSNENQSLVLRYFNKDKPDSSEPTGVNYFFGRSYNTENIVAMIEKNGEGYQEALQYLAEYDRKCLAMHDNMVKSNWAYAFKFIPELTSLLPPLNVVHQLNSNEYILNVTGVFPYYFDLEHIEKFASKDSINKWGRIAIGQESYAKYANGVIFTNNLDNFSKFEFKDIVAELFNTIRNNKLKFKAFDESLNYFHLGLYLMDNLFFIVDESRAARVIKDVNEEKTIDQVKKIFNNWVQDLMGDLFEIIPDFEELSVKIGTGYLKELEFNPIKSAYDDAKQRLKIVSPDDFVYMTGNTYKAKLTLDNQNDSFRLIAEAVGSEIAWRNKAGKGRNNDKKVIAKATKAPNNVWIFQRKMWDYMQSNYAELISEFDLDIKEGN